MQKVTPLTVERALKKALRNLTKDPTLLASEVSAGFSLPPEKQKRGQRTALQIFVRVARYSDEALKDYPESGGLLVNLPPLRGKKGVK